MMDMFQDIIVCSKYTFDPQDQNLEEVNSKSFDHLKDIHRGIIDSIH